MKNRLILMKCAVVLIVATFVLTSAERKKKSIWRSITSPLTAAPQPGYLNNGEPFSLRKAEPLRPPAYALPSLPITPDPQPLPLAALKPAQPLNPAGVQGQETPTTPKATIPAMQVPSIRPLTIRAESTFVAPSSGIHSAISVPAQLPLRNAFLNPKIYRYFEGDANGTIQSRIRLKDNSLFTHPSLSPLLRRQGSTTYQIK